jgi:hypothetical protein
MILKVIETNYKKNSEISWLQFEKEPLLWSQDNQEIFLHFFGLVQGDFKVAKDMSQRHTFLVQSKLLTNAIPRGSREKV